MRCRYLYFVLLTLGFTVLSLAQARDQKAEKSKIIALENAWNQAQIHHDGEALSRLVVDTFVYTDTDGTLLNKSQFIVDSKDPSFVTTLVANEDVEVYFYPGVAIVTGIYHAKGTNRGKAYDHWGRFTDTWIDVDGQWKCAASHTNSMKKPGSK